jgi:hypothetical protein
VVGKREGIIVVVLAALKGRRRWKRRRRTSISVAKTMIDPGLNSSGITISAYSPLSFLPTLISGVSISINSDGMPLKVEVDSLNSGMLVLRDAPKRYETLVRERVIGLTDC